MDIRARNLALAPFTDTGDPADCSWLTKAAALGAFDEDHDSDEGTIEHYSAPSASRSRSSVRSHLPPYCSFFSNHSKNRKPPNL